MVTEVEKIKKHTGRGRPVLLNDVLKQSIILYKSTNPGWSAGKILDSIKINYFNKIRKFHPDWPDSKIRDYTAFPGVNRVQRYLKEISPQLNQKSPLQEKWHLGTMNDYPITPEAVKKIFELKARGKNYISIRIARWISRLSHLPLPIDVLYLSAMEYSTAEEIAEISRTELNTATMDMILQANLRNQNVPGSSSGKPAEMPVRNDITPPKPSVPPVNNVIPETKPEAEPVKENTAPVKAKSSLPKAKITLVKKEIEDVKAGRDLQEAEIASEKSDITPEETDIKPLSKENKECKDKAQKSNYETPAADDKPEIETPAAEEKPEVEKPQAEERSRDSLKKYYLPDMRRRQASIEEFLKFVEKQKDKEQ